MRILKSSRKTPSFTAKGRIIEIRKELTLSQDGFARSFGLTQSGLSALELGSIPLRLMTALAIEAVYGINHAWLLEGLEPKYVIGGITKDEKRLIDLYRATDKDAQRMALRVLDGLAAKTIWDGMRERRGEERRKLDAEREGAGDAAAPSPGIP